MSTLSVDAESTLHALLTSGSARTPKPAPDFVLELALLGLIWRAGEGPHCIVIALTSEGRRLAGELARDQSSDRLKGYGS